MTLRRRLKHFRRALSNRGCILLPVLIILPILIILGLIYGIHKLFLVWNHHIRCPTDICDDMPFLPCAAIDWSEDCDNPKQIKFTSELKSLVVEHINFYRNIYAGNLMFLPYFFREDDDYDGEESGHVPNDIQPPCVRCKIIQWDNDLETLAQVAIKFCNNENLNEYCYRTKQFSDPGQLRFSRHARPYDEHLLYILDKWGRDRKSKEQRMLTHELQTHVGCAMILIGNTTDRSINLLCNFGYKSTSDERDSIYVGRPASDCLTGVDYRYPYLCTGDEIIERPTFDSATNYEKPFGFLYKLLPGFTSLDYGHGNLGTP